MTPESSPPDDLSRLRQEREAADRAYNDALTALDAALQRLRDLPAAPPPFDDARMAELNEKWEILRDSKAGRSARFGRARTSHGSRRSTPPSWII